MNNFRAILVRSCEIASAIDVSVYLNPEQAFEYCEKLYGLNANNWEVVSTIFDPDGSWSYKDSTMDAAKKCSPVVWEQEYEPGQVFQVHLKKI